LPRFCAVCPCCMVAADRRPTGYFFCPSLGAPPHPRHLFTIKAYFFQYGSLLRCSNRVNLTSAPRPCSVDLSPPTLRDATSLSLDRKVTCAESIVLLLLIGLWSWSPALKSSRFSHNKQNQTPSDCRWNPLVPLESWLPIC